MGRSTTVVQEAFYRLSQFFARLFPILACQMCLKWSEHKTWKLMKLVSAWPRMSILSNWHFQSPSPPLHDGLVQLTCTFAGVQHDAMHVSKWTSTCINWTKHAWNSCVRMSDMWIHDSLFNPTAIYKLPAEARLCGTIKPVNQIHTILTWKSQVQVICWHAKAYHIDCPNLWNKPSLSTHIRTLFALLGYYGIEYFSGSSMPSLSLPQ